jgi:hypothetical protein
VTGHPSTPLWRRPEALFFAAFVLIACLPLAVLIWRDVVNGWIWLGSDGGAAVQDQMQYVNWIRDASENLLVSNHYRAEPGEASYLHPGAVLSGALVKLGLSAKLGYLLWKPVAVVALFLAITAFVRRLVPRGRGLWVALALALFYLPPTVLLFGDDVDWTVTSGELWPIDMLWGYFFSALGMAGLMAVLLLYERDRSARRVGVWTPLVGLFAAWFQPWAGALAIGIIAGSEAVIWLLRRRGGTSVGAPDPRVLLVALGAIAVPLAYYSVLGRVDPSWRIDNAVDSFLDPPWWVIAVHIAPLALPALLAYRLRPESFADVAVRVWPAVALGLYWVLSGPAAGRFAPHALRCLGVPLAVLAVVGLSRTSFVRAPYAAAVTAVALVLLIVPGTLDRLDDFRSKASRNEQPFFLKPGEREALDFLEASDVPGSVLAPVEMGQIIPSETGRRTNVGNIFWTPDFLRRRLFTDIFFRGNLGAEASRGLVRNSGSRFLMSGCGGYADLSPLLRPLLVSVRRFGCATVYEVRVS